MCMRAAYFSLDVLLIQKADYFRQQMLPYVPDELQGVAALAASHRSMVSVMGWDFYSLSYQSAFRALGEGSTSPCLSVGRNCKRENPTQPPCSGHTMQVLPGEVSQPCFSD